MCVHGSRDEHIHTHIYTYIHTYTFTSEIPEPSLFIHLKSGREMRAVKGCEGKKKVVKRKGGKKFISGHL